MADEHPLEQLLRDAKDKDDLTAAALDAEQRKTSELQEAVQTQWLETKVRLLDEIERANAILTKHNLRERYTFRELPELWAGQPFTRQFGFGLCPSFEISSRRVRHDRDRC